MRARKRIQCKTRQQGVALLLAMLLVIVAVAIVVPSLLTPIDPDMKRAQQTREALLTARQALLGHVARYYEYKDNGISIRMPCPDMNTSGFNEGGAEAACDGDNITAIGRFPWRSFDLPALKDANGECLWYVVSGNYKSQNNFEKSVVNEDTYGLIRMFDADDPVTPVYGQTAETRLVAAIISPGAARTGEDRNADSNGHGVAACGGNYDPRNYLDSTGSIDNASPPGIIGAIMNLAHFDAQSNVGNDQIIPITRDEVMQIIHQRNDLENKQRNLVTMMAECIRQYGLAGGNNARLPWPAPVSITGGDNYADQEKYNDTTGTYLGRFPYIIDDSNNVTGSLSEDELFENTFCSLKNNTEWRKFYNDWKDHLFYALAKAREPAGTPSSGCGSCLTVNGQAMRYSAILIFAGNAEPGQSRTVSAPLGATTDSNTRSWIGNYLEGRNASNYPDTSGDKDYQYDAALNDILYCIPDNLNSGVIECPYVTP